MNCQFCNNILKQFYSGVFICDNCKSYFISNNVYVGQVINYSIQKEEIETIEFSHSFIFIYKGSFPNDFAWYWERKKEIFVGNDYFVNKPISETRECLIKYLDNLEFL